MPLSDEWTPPAIERTFVVPPANPRRDGVAAWLEREAAQALAERLARGRERESDISKGG
jgi:hypothetical protein